MMFEKYGQAFCMIAVGLVLLYASYCCIDYDFFKTDYVARFNQLNVDPNQPENAWPYYVLAGANYEELQEELEHKIRNIRKPDQSELSSDEIASLQEWLDKNTSSWESLCRATSIPYCNATYKHISLLTSTTDQDDFSSPSDAGYGQIRCLYKNTCACHLAGLIELNWFDLFQMQLISSKHFTNGKTLIANFVGYGMLSSATKLLSQQDSYQLDDLRKARELLKEYFPANLPSLNIEGEILILCSSHDNMINMKKIPVQSPFNPLFLFFGSAGGTEKHLRKKFMTELDQAKKGIEVSQKSLGIADMFRPGRSFIGFFGGSFYKAYKISQRAHANLLAAYVLLDIEEYYLKERSYPENIPQLREAGFISQLPDDPDTDSTIIYRNDSQRAILYAVGPNSKDDGGYRDDKGCDEKRDDTIYWQRNLTETGK